MWKWDGSGTDHQCPLRCVGGDDMFLHREDDGHALFLGDAKGRACRACVSHFRRALCLVATGVGVLHWRRGVCPKQHAVLPAALLRGKGGYDFKYWGGERVRHRCIHLGLGFVKSAHFPPFYCPHCSICNAGAPQTQEAVGKNS